MRLAASRLSWLLLAVRCPAGHARVTELRASLLIEAPDCLNRNVVSVNGRGTGKVEPLRLTVGEKVGLVVVNDLEGVSITVHWHGIDQMSTPWADGTANVNACPMRPGYSHLMEFEAPRVPGTYFWHGHLSIGNAMGMQGLLLVDWPDEGPSPEQRLGEYYLRDERPWPARLQVPLLLSDWYNAPALAIVTGLSAENFRWPGGANSLLVNGVGQPNCSLALAPPGVMESSPLTMVKGYELCNASLHDKTRYEECLRELCERCSETNVWETEVEANETYMLRIVNGAMLMLMNVYIENHTMTVFELDGWPVDPIEVPSLDLHTGQRAAVLIKTDQPANAYWISIRYRARESPVIGRAILRYTGYSGTADTSRLFGEVQDHHPAWFDTDFSFRQQQGYSTRQFDLSRYWEPLDPVPPEQRIVLLNTQERFKAGADHHIPSSQPGLDTTRIGTGSELPGSFCKKRSSSFLRWGVARVNFEWPETPLLQALYFQTDDLAGYKRDGGFYRMDLGKVYEVVIQDFPACNGVCESHPWHMHGTKFWHVGTWRGTYNGSYEAGTGGGQYIRDTIQVVGQNTSKDTNLLEMSESHASEGCGFTVIRFKASNPGAWPFHCHIEWHFVMGMFAVFYTDPETIPAPPPGYRTFNHKCGEVPRTNGATASASRTEGAPSLLIIALSVAIAVLAFAFCLVMVCAWHRIQALLSQQASLRKEMGERQQAEERAGEGAQAAQDQDAEARELRIADSDAEDLECAPGATEAWCVDAAETPETRRLVHAVGYVKNQRSW